MNTIDSHITETLFWLHISGGEILGPGISLTGRIELSPIANSSGMRVTRVIVTLRLMPILYAVDATLSGFLLGKNKSA